MEWGSKVEMCTFTVYSKSYYVNQHMYMTLLLLFQSRDRNGSLPAIV